MMKNLWILTFCLLSKSLMACPEITGNYSCDSSSENGKIVIQFNRELEQYSLKIDEEETVPYKISNQYLKINTDGLETKAVCDEKSVKLYLQYPKNSTPSDTLAISGYFTLKPVENGISFQFTMDDLIDQEIFCKKITELK